MSLKLGFTLADLQAKYDAMVRVKTEAEHLASYETKKVAWASIVSGRITMVMSNGGFVERTRALSDTATLYFTENIGLYVVADNLPMECLEKMLDWFVRDFNQANGPAFTLAKHRNSGETLQGITVSWELTRTEVA